MRDLLRSPQHRLCRRSGGHARRDVCRTPSRATLGAVRRRRRQTGGGDHVNIRDPAAGRAHHPISRQPGPDCSLICPFIVQLAVEPAFRFAIIPVTFAAELQSGQPLLNAIARTDATVSGAANAALTGIIDNDLGLVLPRAQNALEVAVVGLIDVGTTAVTQPGNILSAINSARTNFLAGLQQPPGTMPPPVVHNALEAGAVRVIEVVSSLTFQAPERLLLGVTQAADALFSTLGATGNIGSALAATGASVATTVRESAAFVRHALTEPIPVSQAVTAAVTVAPKTATSAAAVTSTATAATESKSSTAPDRSSITKRALTAVTTPLHRIAKADNDTPSAKSSATGSSKPAAKHDDGDRRRPARCASQRV